MSLTLKQLATQIEVLSARISALEAELEHQKRINVLIQKGKYGPGTSQPRPTSPIRSLQETARTLATQATK
jgi:hypothetical protein